MAGHGVTAAVGAVLSCALVLAVGGCAGGPAGAPGSAVGAETPVPSLPTGVAGSLTGAAVRPDGSDGPDHGHRPGTVVRVITGDNELGISDEGEWLALLPYSRGERGTAVHIGSVDADAMSEPGSGLGEAVVPADADMVAVALLSCPAAGCDDDVMRAEAERPAVVGMCEVDARTAPGTAIDVVIDRPSLGYPDRKSVV